MQPFQSPAAWRGSELLDDPNWQHELSADEISQLQHALQAVNAKGLDMQQITTEDFPLGSLAQRLAEARGTLEDGCGSFFLRGWPVAGYSLEDNRRVFWGLSRHLGTPISQSATGEHLFHVEDAGFGEGHAKARGPNTSKGLSFHCDRCDVIGFLCVRQAKEGGENCLVSSITVHNAILEQRPDLLEELYQPWYYKTHNVDVSNPDPWCRQPIFAIEQGPFRGLRVASAHRPCLPDARAAGHDAAPEGSFGLPRSHLRRSVHALPLPSAPRGLSSSSTISSTSTPAPSSSTMLRPSAVDCCCGSGSPCPTVGRCRRRLRGLSAPRRRERFGVEFTRLHSLQSLKEHRGRSA